MNATAYADGRDRTEKGMRYDHYVKGRFEDRRNRFIARVWIEGRLEDVHVKNTGRCAELFVKGAEVYVQKTANTERKTKYDLIAVKKAGQIINVDSLAPNRAVLEWLKEGGFLEGIRAIRPEYTYRSSRFDFYVETEREKIFIEVKGVTLENGGVAAFPDAPSERAVKHVEELIRAKEEGYRACILFVLQMKLARSLIPNRDTHPAFADALERAARSGVEILAYDCRVEPGGMRLDGPVPVYMSGEQERLSRIAGPLTDWYGRTRRILPWREEPSPYRVWVSEIMLQQTRVEAVKPYFERFMAALPDIASLAEVEEEPLLKLWEGLGYYNRARSLKKAAQLIMEEYGGEMPDAYEELLKLPGIGSYTAGAVASIAFHRKHPAVDGNVLRVVMRLLADESDILGAGVKRRVEELLLAVMPEERPGDFNQALMELGAVVCIPNGVPKCGSCPLSELCLAREQGRMTEFPKKAPRKKRTVEDKTVLMIRDAKKVALRRRPDKGLLAGMYEFPWLEGRQNAERVLAYLKELGLKPVRITALGESRHVFTHKEWHMTGYYIRVDELEENILLKEGKELLFADAGELARDIPVPSAFAAYTGRMMDEERKNNEAFDGCDSML